MTWSADDTAFAAAYAEYILLATDAGAQSDVGAYPVTGSVDGTPAGIGNYKIIFKEGTYTVTAKPVTVTITPNGGVYGNVTGAAAEFADGDIVNGDAVTVTFLYSGTAHDGTVYNNAEQAPAAAGIYTVTAMLAGADAGNYSLAPASAVFIVDRQEISVPAAQSTPYTGEALQATGEAFETNAIYTVTQGDHWVDVNTYTVVLTLVDSNYKWAGLDGTVAAVEVDFTITQAENKFTADPSVTGWAYGAYDAAVNAPTGAKADFGDVIYEYAVRTGDDASAVTEWLLWEEDAAAALPAGDYWLIAVVTAERNWTGAQSAAVGFTVERAVLALPALTQEETPYTGDELSNEILHFDAAKMSLAVSGGARAEDGVVYATDGGTYTVTLTLTDLNYRWEGGDTVVLTWTITAAENEITWINFDAEWTYARAPEPETPSLPTRCCPTGLRATMRTSTGRTFCRRMRAAMCCARTSRGRTTTPRPSITSNLSSSPPRSTSRASRAMRAPMTARRTTRARRAPPRRRTQRAHGGLRRGGGRRGGHLAVQPYRHGRLADGAVHLHRCGRIYRLL